MSSISPNPYIKLVISVLILLVRFKFRPFKVLFIPVTIFTMLPANEFRLLKSIVPISVSTRFITCTNSDILFKGVTSILRESNRMGMPNASMLVKFTFTAPICVAKSFK